MSRLPAIFADGRRMQIGLVAAAALSQGVAAAAVAFATRDVFATLRIVEGAGAGAATSSLPVADIATILVGGTALAGMRVIERVMAERVGQSYASAVRERLFLHLSRTPAHVMASHRVGTLSLRFVGDLTAIKGWISSGLARLISAGITIPASILILFALDPVFGLAAIPPFALALLLIGFFSRPLEEAYARLRKRRNRMAADIAERLPQSAALRKIGRLKHERMKLTDHSRQIAEAAVRRALASGLLRAVPDLSAAVASVLFLTMAWHFRLSTADTAASLTVLAMIVRPMRQLAGVWDRRQAWSVAATHLDTVLSTRRLPRGDKREARAETEDSGVALEFHDVRVASGERLSGEVPVGDWVRLSRPREAGNDSLLLVSAGLDFPVGGDVAVFGGSPWSIPVGHVLYLGPSSPVLKGSLRRNAAMGAGKIPDDDTIIAALEKAGLRSLVERLGGLDGRINESARNLSGYELAQLLCARALLVRPRLLLADADEIGLTPESIRMLHDELQPLGCSALIASRSRQPDDIFRRTLISESPGAAEAPIRAVS
ncbi:MAG: hypothetical protein CL534_15415 [Ahrensia sp.]|nr:hypothetical protein [Ahrensia sp.]